MTTPYMTEHKIHSLAAMSGKLDAVEIVNRAEKALKEHNAYYAKLLADYPDVIVTKIHSKEGMFQFYIDNNEKRRVLVVATLDYDAGTGEATGYTTISVYDDEHLLNDTTIKVDDPSDILLASTQLEIPTNSFRDAIHTLYDLAVYNDTIAYLNLNEFNQRKIFLDVGVTNLDVADDTLSVYVQIDDTHSVFKDDLNISLSTLNTDIKEFATDAIADFREKLDHDFEIHLVKQFPLVFAAATDRLLKAIHEAVDYYKANETTTLGSLLDEMSDSYGQLDEGDEDIEIEYLGSEYSHVSERIELHYAIIINGNRKEYVIRCYDQLIPEHSFDTVYENAILPKDVLRILYKRLGVTADNINEELQREIDTFIYEVYK